MDLTVVEARLDGSANEAVLIDPRLSLELSSGDDRPQVIAATLVDDLDLGARQGGLDHRLQLGKVGHLRNYSTRRAGRRATADVVGDDLGKKVA